MVAILDCIARQLAASPRITAAAKAAAGSSAAAAAILAAMDQGGTRSLPGRALHGSGIASSSAAGCLQRRIPGTLY
eukprot:SAG31_NODE_10224_length_1168_cov_1.094481_1_plen_75_part_01